MTQDVIMLRDDGTLERLIEVMERMFIADDMTPLLNRYDLIKEIETSYFKPLVNSLNLNTFTQFIIQATEWAESLSSSVLSSEDQLSIPDMLAGFIIYTNDTYNWFLDNLPAQQEGKYRFLYEFHRLNYPHVLIGVSRIEWNY